MRAPFFRESRCRGRLCAPSAGWYSCGTPISVPPAFRPTQTQACPSSYLALQSLAAASLALDSLALVTLPFQSTHEDGLVPKGFSQGFIPSHLPLQVAEQGSVRAAIPPGNAWRLASL